MIVIPNERISRLASLRRTADAAWAAFDEHASSGCRVCTPEWPCLAGADAAEAVMAAETAYDAAARGAAGGEAPR